MYAHENKTKQKITYLTNHDFDFALSRQIFHCTILQRDSHRDQLDNNFSRPPFTSTLFDEQSI